MWVVIVLQSFFVFANVIFGIIIEDHEALLLNLQDFEKQWSRVAVLSWLIYKNCICLVITSSIYVRVQVLLGHSLHKHKLFKVEWKSHIY
jgi:hypothetical protein